MDFFTTLKDTPVPTLLILGGIIFLFLGIATIKKPIVLDVPPSSRRISLILGIILVGSGLYSLGQPPLEKNETTQETPTAADTSNIVFEVNKEASDGCFIRFNGVHIDPASTGPLIWDWGDGNFTEGYFPQEHTYSKSGSYVVNVEAPSGLKQNYIIDVDCLSITPDSAFFSLANTEPDNYYTINDGTFLFLENGDLAVAGGYGGGTYINHALPRNFRITIQFTIEDSADQFILGLSNGKEMRPNYHVVMTSTGTSFKQQLSFDITEGWDKYIKSTGFSIKPGSTYEIVLERNNGNIDIFANNVNIFRLGTADIKDINSFDYLYLTGARYRQIIITNLVIEDIQQ